MTSSSASLSSNNNDNNKNMNLQSPQQPQPKKVHTLTVCMVPPPSESQVWAQLSEMREFLKDPGFYRWPPHCNLLYPFVQYSQSSTIEEDKKYMSLSSDDNSLEEIVRKLRTATQSIEPFRVSLNAYGTFGGKNRGVLWLFPDSQPLQSASHDSESSGTSSTTVIPASPLLQLQSALEEAFPMCTDLSNKGGPFAPHMTLSHFESLDDALQAQDTASTRFSLDTLQFDLDRIYLLERRGDGGQFCRVAEIFLGNGRKDNQNATTLPWKVFTPAQSFPDMPTEEATWVYEERMAMKQRRNRKGRRRQRRRYSNQDEQSSNNDNIS